MSIVEEIIAAKREEVRNRKERYPIKLLEEGIYFEAPPVSLVKYLTRPDKVGIIAEIKRRSPSAGVLNSTISVEQLSIAYMQAGASALSVLTDEKYFGGTNEDLTVARKYNFCPILRKDFTVDEYQIIEAKSIGADAVLLIAAVLSEEEIKKFAQLAKSLGMEVLLEVHNEEELGRSLCEEIDLVGVNNRNLKDMTTDVQQSFALAEKIPSSKIKVSESGISSAQTIRGLKGAGFQGFLIGEAFMKSSMPHRVCRRLIRELRKAD